MERIMYIADSFKGFLSMARQKLLNVFLPIAGRRPLESRRFGRCSSKLSDRLPLSAPYCKQFSHQSNFYVDVIVDPQRLFMDRFDQTSFVTQQN
jgi:hypothetical protein